MAQFKRFSGSESQNYNSGYVGREGELTWDPDNGLRIHDGNESGGNPIGITSYQNLNDLPTNLASIQTSSSTNNRQFLRYNSSTSEVEYANDFKVVPFADIDYPDGVVGDKVGDVAFDDSGIYYCGSEPNYIGDVTITSSSGYSNQAWITLTSIPASGPVQVGQRLTDGVNTSTVEEIVEAWPGYTGSREIIRLAAATSTWHDGTPGTLSVISSGESVSTGNWVKFSKSYNDLTDKPTIPADVSDLTDTTNLLSGGGGGGVSLPADAAGVLKNDGSGTLTWATLDIQDLNDSGNLLTFTQAQADWDELNSISPSYIQNKPTLVTSYLSLTDTPTDVSTFNNDAGYLTGTPWTNEGYLTSVDMPVNVSAFANDANYLTSITTSSSGAGEISYSAGLLTYTGPELALVATSGSYSDLIGTPDSILDLSITDGSNGQVLTTDGVGTFSFTTPTVDANNLTGTTLASGVVNSSLTSVGTLANLTVSGTTTLNGTESNVVRRAFGLVAADTFVTLDDLKVKVTSSTSQLGLALTTGSWQATGWTETFQGGGTPSVNNWINLPLSTGYDNASGAMPNQGNGCRCVISDQTPNAKMYQITAMRAGTSGAMWNISIERLV
jgi:hypothetical protein